MERATARDAAPVFVIGNPRSGTTMLRLMLTCHPEISVPPEGGFLVQLYERYKGFSGEEEIIESFVEEALSKPKMEEWGLTREGLTAYLAEKTPLTYPELASGVYEHYSAVHQGGKRRWGDKNNFFLNHVATIADLLPEARFVHVVRDGRDIACSYRDLATVEGKYAPQLPNSVSKAARQWRGNLMEIHRGFDHAGQRRTYELRYEDLVAEPESTLRELCDFIGEEYDEEMLDFGERNREKLLEPRGFDAWKSRTKEGLSSSRVGRWRTEMFTEDLTLFELEAGNMLDGYGYPLAFSERSRAARAFITLYRTGSNVSLWFSANVRRLRRTMGRVRRALRAQSGKNF